LIENPSTDTLDQFHFLLEARSARNCHRPALSCFEPLRPFCLWTKSPIVWTASTLLFTRGSVMDPNDILMSDEAQILIHRKACQLADRYRFRDMDSDDLAQELCVRLLTAVDDYDPESGALWPFLETVIDRLGKMILRERRAAKRDAGKQKSLHRVAESAQPSDPHTLDPDQSDRAIDVAAAIAALPPDLQEIVEQLRTGNITEVAEARDTPRTSLARKIARIRKHFEKAGLEIYLSRRKRTTDLGTSDSHPSPSH
jgi:RNA polymerase sigma factor (sigma-70 family)